MVEYSWKWNAPDLALGLLGRLTKGIKAEDMEYRFQAQCTLVMDLEGKGMMAYVARARSDKPPTYKRQLDPSTWYRTIKGYGIPCHL